MGAWQAVHAHVACGCNNAVSVLVVLLLKAVQSGCKVCLATHRQIQLHHAACVPTTCSSLLIGIGSSHLDRLAQSKHEYQMLYRMMPKED